MSMSGPGLGEAFGKWGMRIVMAFGTYLLLPLEIVLYPIAAIPAFFVGRYILNAATAAGFRFDDAMSYGWTAAWLVMLPVMRFETGVEAQVPGYRFLRHLFRLLAGAGSFYYICIHDQGAPPQAALIVSLISLVLLHFFLRWGLLRGMWHAFQRTAWLRK